jgi:hypothetical protein
MIFENCYQGDNKTTWQTALGDNVDIVGWNGMTVPETISFNNFGLFDRQDNNLHDYLEKAVEYRNSDSYIKGK